MIRKMTVLCAGQGMIRSSSLLGFCVKKKGIHVPQKSNSNFE